MSPGSQKTRASLPAAGQCSWHHVAHNSMRHKCEHEFQPRQRYAQCTNKVHVKLQLGMRALEEMNSVAGKGSTTLASAITARQMQ